MSFLFIEIFICIAFVFILYQCCVRNARRSSQLNENQNQNQEDLQRVRQRLSSERATSRTTGTASERAVARKVLIEQNLFSRRIIRGDASVKDLSQLLAISRGGIDSEIDIDIELGGIPATSAEVDDEELDAAANNMPTISGVPEVAAADDMPTPSAPLQEATSTTRTTDTIATAISTHPVIVELNDDNPERRPSVTLRNLWNNLTSSANNLNLERDIASASASALQKPNANTSCSSDSRNTTHHKNGMTYHKMECSICLENFVSNDLVAWAKDGGDPPPQSQSSSAAVAASSMNNAGCDHIFHKDCIFAWLVDHDECPLCRRMVVHADADTRFAGWDNDNA